MSQLTGIGVGPGDPDLLTVKAVKAIHNADINNVSCISRR